MSPEPDNAPKVAPKDLPEAAGGASTLGEFCTPLLEDFPDPVLIADGHQKVVFLNRAAEKIFGASLRLGDPCPICTQLTGLPLSADGTVRRARCLEHGENLNRAPILPKAGWASRAPLTVTATPIRGQGEEPSGCLVVLREHAELLGHPVVQLQMATLSSILENFPIPFFMVDPDLVVTHMNERLERLTGYSSKEAVGRMTCGQVLDSPQCGTCDCVLKQVMETRKPISGLRRVVRDRVGREIPVTVSASIITDPSGRVIGGFEAFRDITPIIEAEQKIDLLTEHTREGLLMADENQRVVYLNTPMAEILRQSKKQVLGRHLGEILTSQHLHMAQELSNRVEQGQERETRFCSLLDLPHKGDKPRVFETCMAVSRLGTKVLTCLYLRDLTERVRIERELQKTNAFLHNIIKSSVDGIVVVDIKGVPIIFNEGAERILGYQAKEIIGNPENFRRFYPPELAAEMMQRMRGDEYGPADKLNTTRLTFINKNGEEVPVNFSATIIRERGQEVGSVGIFSDLREILKVHQELEATQHQLVQAEKIASLGRMAAGVAHEINNPLAGILIYAELLARELEQDAPIRENVEIIINQTMRCQQIVSRLLDFSRQSLGQKRLFDVNEVLRACVDLVSHQVFFHNIKIEQDLDPGVPQIIGDPGQLQQVFTNLLLNGADAMSDSGVITITSRPAWSGNGVVLQFADTGCGIPPEIRDKIFEPFFTTKPPGKGTGLGLSIVYGVLQRHGGSIEAYSPPGGGTIFTVTLPLESEDQGLDAGIAG
ncbi:MAG: PAS domain S-box protein [Deltaproteobacteria bacterium]|nr:PAS domain S-box protein [Deltaproteobacteria bacterium]